MSRFAPDRTGEFDELISPGCAGLMPVGTTALSGSHNISIDRSSQESVTSGRALFDAHDPLANRSHDRAEEPLTGTKGAGE